MNKQPLVSVIIPVYNIENLLTACVDSVLGQDYRRLEILLVDDGSTDSSGVLCDQLSGSDPRVRVIHKQNGGLSDARNVGIRNSRGKLVTCIDGDDYVTPRYVSNLVSCFHADQVDIAVTGFERVPPGFSRRNQVSLVSEPKLLTADQALLDLFYQRTFATSAWGKLYRRELFDGIEYPVGEIHEDLPVTYRLVDRARKVAFTGTKDYFYVQHGASITAMADYEKRLSAITFANDAVLDMSLRSHRHKRAAEVRLFMECVYLISQVGSSNELKQLSPVVKEYVRSTRK